MCSHSAQKYDFYPNQPIAIPIFINNLLTFTTQYYLPQGEGVPNVLFFRALLFESLKPKRIFAVLKINPTIDDEEIPALRIFASYLHCCQRTTG